MSSFAEILDELGVDYETEGPNTRPGWLQMMCPWCMGEDYLGFNTFGNYCNCWRCGYKSAIDLLLKTSNVTFKQAKELTSDLTTSGFQRADIRQGTLTLPDGIGKLLQPHRKYLKGRGFNVQELKRLWGIQGIGPIGEHRWRIFIPIHLNGVVVSWTTRSISDKVAVRYLSASLDEESVPHKTLLYGEDYCRHSVVVCEGPIDVWRIGPGAVATCGVGFKEAQILRLSKYPVRVVCFDSERQAQRRAKKLCDALEVFSGTTYRVELDSKDPGSATKREIRKIRRRFLE